MFQSFYICIFLVVRCLHATQSLYLLACNDGLPRSHLFVCFFPTNITNGKGFQVLLSLHVVAFVYMDANANDDSDLPDELKQKYTIAKLLGRYTLNTFVKILTLPHLFQWCT